MLTDLMEKPIWKLTAADLDALPPAERQWATSHLGFLQETGTLALLLANPKGTKYETVWEDGRWKLKPAPQFDPAEALDAMRTIVREEITAALVAHTPATQAGGEDR